MGFVRDRRAGFQPALAGRLAHVRLAVEYARDGLHRYARGGRHVLDPDTHVTPQMCAQLNNCVLTFTLGASMTTLSTRKAQGFPWPASCPVFPMRRGE